MKRLALLAGISALALSAGANATLISNSSQDGAGQDLQSLFTGEGGWIIDDAGSPFVVNDEAQVASTWQIGASSGSFSKIVIEIAGNANLNSFGIYNPNNTSQRLQIFAGADSSSASRTIEYLGGGQFQVYGSDVPTTTANLGGASFGFYLANENGAPEFFSDPEGNRGATQMVAFQGDGQSKVDFYGAGSATWLTNEWVLAWEDQAYANSDKDFNDFVVLVESVHPVPEPMTLGLMGLGLIAVGFGSRRRRKVAA
jgi:hypothetical protein